MNSNIYPGSQPSGGLVPGGHWHPHGCCCHRTVCQMCCQHCYCRTSVFGFQSQGICCKCGAIQPHTNWTLMNGAAAGGLGDTYTIN